VDEADDAFERRARQRVGTTLCRKYKLEALLGVGGMAAVYRGTHRNGNRVAVKVLHPELSLHQDIRERFLREGYVANGVGHDGAVRVLDDDVADDGTVFIVMELLEGETLEQHAHQAGGTLSPAELVPLASQLLDVLKAAHASGIIHRDVKPENLFLVRRTHTLKVLDFGIARLTDLTKQATRSGRLLGTPAYMSPEQARGETKTLDGRSDVWAVGALLFRLLSGRPVHEAETAEMSIILAATKPARSILSVLPECEPKLASIVDRALALEKADRWSSALEMVEALRSLATLSSVRARQSVSCLAFDPTTPLAANDLSSPSTTAKVQHVELTLASPAATPATEPSISGVVSASEPRASSPIDVNIAPRKRGRLPQVVSGLVLLGATVGLLVWSRGGGGSSQPHSEAAGVMPPLPESSIAATSAAPEAVAAHPTPAATPVVSDEGAPELVPKDASARPAKATGHPPKRRPPGGVSPVPAATPAVDCTTPYTLTASGTRKYKPECVE
jgi:eukaryotic-like serine/threonine-protein kinase